MAKKNKSVPQYGTVTRKGILYYRTRIQDADGKQVSLYATTCEELYEKQLEQRSRSRRSFSAGSIRRLLNIVRNGC